MDTYGEPLAVIFREQTHFGVHLAEPEDRVTGMQGLKALGADSHMIKEPLRVMGPERTMVEVPGKYAVFQVLNGQHTYMGDSSERYVPISAIDIFSQLDKLGLPLVLMARPNSNRIVAGYQRDSYDIIGEKYISYVYIDIPFDTKAGAASMFLTEMRIRCTNQLPFMTSGKLIASVTHSELYKALLGINTALLQLASDLSHNIQVKMEELASFKMTDEDMDDFIVDALKYEVSEDTTPADLEEALDPAKIEDWSKIVTKSENYNKRQQMMQQRYDTWKSYAMRNVPAVKRELAKKTAGAADSMYVPVTAISAALSHVHSQRGRKQPLNSMVGPQARLMENTFNKALTIVRG